MSASVRENAPRPRLHAVCWDMDGTIVDTERYWLDGERELVEAHGGTWTDDLRARLLGNNLPDTTAILRTDGHVGLSPARIVEHLEGYVAARTRERMPWRPGACELLAALRTAGVRLALVTMAYRGTARDVVDRLPAGTFDTVVTGEQVRHGKPDPEPYRTALDRLGVDAGHALAVEDSPGGVRSATGAGLVTVCVAHDAPLLPGPRRVLCPTLAGVTVGRLERLLSSGGAVPVRRT